MHYLSKNFPLDDPSTPLLFDQVSIWSAHFGNLLLNNIPIRKEATVLDVGCGTGFPLIELAQLFGPAARLIGIDPWKAALDRAEWKTKKQELENVRLMEGDAGEMSFETGTFDLVVSNVGVNNFDDPPQVMKECHRVLKKNGVMAITTNISGHYQEFYRVFEITLKDCGRKDLVPELKAQEAHRGTEDSVRKLFEKSNFRDLKILTDSFQMRFADGTSLLNHLLVIVGFLPAWRAILPPEEQKEFFRLLEQKLNERAAREGELRMTVPMLYAEGTK